MQVFEEIKTALDDPKIFGIVSAIIILVFAIAGGKKGLYGKAVPILIIVAAPVIGLIALDKVDTIADSRIITFIACSVAAWVMLMILKKIGDLVVNWFVLGWLNRIAGFIIGAMEGLIVVLILRIIL